MWPLGAGQVQIGPVRRGGRPLHAEFDWRERGRAVCCCGRTDTQVCPGRSPFLVWRYQCKENQVLLHQAIKNEHANQYFHLNVWPVPIQYWRRWAGTATMMLNRVRRPDPRQLRFQSNWHQALFCSPDGNMTLLKRPRMHCQPLLQDCLTRT